ncbi:MAG TPA: hypothetical protein DIC46_09440 [Porphyromonadaceae bacterium]|jgi:hypothetical protein|nr:hypothetical protein [Porphyromonadaceae bacterium]
MDKILKLKIFRFLSEYSSRVTNEEMKNAYGCFMEQVKTISESGNNFSETFRILNLSCIELVFIESDQYGQGKKRPEICLPQKGDPIS